ncbi:putative antigen [Echinococcus granulosus]|uniref:Antigen n=1 Tax=Echinococcus granulosus TaxID=6210 RepID=W6UVS4_ECHGR|nr:putative antigen [Echinococcus granulosus]EUB64741.1 putative antigen [Echinococcus granulosus]
MVFYFSLIVLTTFLLAEKSRGDSPSPALREASLWQYFKWRHIEYDTFKLSWVDQRLTELGVTDVAVFAIPFSKFGYPKVAISTVKQGKLTLRGLLPDTKYEFTTIALHHRDQVLRRTVYGTTGPLGRTGPGRIFPPPNIYCYPMKENAIRVAWGVEEMGDRGVDKIIVKARAVNGTGHNRTEKVYAGAAQVTLEDLTPETLYRVSMDAYRNGTLIFGSERFIKTWPAGKRGQNSAKNIGVSETHTEKWAKTKVLVNPLISKTKYMQLNWL